MKKKLVIGAIALVGLAVGFGGGKYFTYTATPDYIMDKAEEACQRNNMRRFAKGAYMFAGGETKKITDEQIAKLPEVGAGECPYKDLFSKKRLKSQSSPETIQTLGVDNAVRYSFEGSDRAFRVIKKDGGWHLLLISS